MAKQNKTSATPKRSRASRSTPAPSKGISRADTRRSTYVPGRKAGVHARELGIKRG